MNRTRYRIEGVVFKKCPVCKNGKVERLRPKGLWSLINSSVIVCDKCGAKFNPGEEYHNEETYELDLSDSNRKSNYAGKTLKRSEWERGLSDLDLCVKNNKLPNATIQGLSIILESGEKTHWAGASSLVEEKAIRRSHGGAVRVMRGVYIGGSQSESHGELRTLDRGNLVLTSRRLIFNGRLRNAEYTLSRIISIEEYEDAIEVAASNRKKLQIFVVGQPHEWATYLRLAIKLSKK